MKQAKDKVVKDISEVSKSEWAYYIGYGITFFIPTAAVASVLGKAGKVGKMLGKLLVWIEKVLGELFEIGLKRGGAVVDNLLAFFQGVVSKFKKGTQEVRGVRLRWCLLCRQRLCFASRIRSVILELLLLAQMDNCAPLLCSLSQSMDLPLAMMPKFCHRHWVERV
ncbi:MAG: hypothetical protein M9931_06950 [Chitinophagales bacterium]|nr:hypothetical protein [Chitinophagales bacterium]